MTRVMTHAHAPALRSTAKLLKLAYTGHDLLPLHQSLIEKLHAQPQDPATLMDLCTLEQLLGDQESGLQRQAQALARECLYQSSRPASPRALRVLAFMAPGDIGTNTPIEFLLQGADAVLYTLYVQARQPLPRALPPHDIAIVTVGEADSTRAILQALARETVRWPCRVLNSPDHILDLSRDRLQKVLEGVPGLVMPPTVRITRDAFGRLGENKIALTDFFTGASFPIIARPVDSHAGRGLEKLETPSAIHAYIASHADVAFYISPYVDYRSADGLFRKYRIVWVDGTPYPCHMAICSEWKVWYLNADMEASPAKRAEEADFMTSFASGFARRHEAALATVARRLGLDYVGIDCAETPDGELLVFEGDISLIVHDMDRPDLFPYKQPAMHKLFAAFQAMLKRHSSQHTVSEELLQS